MFVPSLVSHPSLPSLHIPHPLSHLHPFLLLPLLRDLFLPSLFLISIPTLLLSRWHPAEQLPISRGQTLPPSPRETHLPSRPMAAPSTCPAREDLHLLDRPCITPAPLYLHRYKSLKRVQTCLGCHLMNAFSTPLTGALLMEVTN